LATVSAAGGGPTVDPDTLTVAATAIRDHEQLRFDYVAHDGEATTRRTEPHRLVYTGRRWYLLGWDVDRRDWRTFRADRIRPRLPTGPRFTPREPPEDPVAHVVRGAGSLAWRHPAKVRFHAPVEQLAEQLAPAGGLLTPIDKRSCLLETGGDSLHELAAYLGSLGVAFNVLDPPELRALLRDLAARYAAAANQPQ